MKTIKDLKEMISEPASKEWFKKHGSKKKEIAKKMSKSEILRESFKHTKRPGFLEASRLSKINNALEERNQKKFKN